MALMVDVESGDALVDKNKLLVLLAVVVVVVVVATTRRVLAEVVREERKAATRPRAIMDSNAWIDVRRIARF